MAKSKIPVDRISEERIQEGIATPRVTAAGADIASFGGGQEVAASQTQLGRGIGAAGDTAIEISEVLNKRKEEARDLRTQFWADDVERRFNEKKSEIAENVKKFKGKDAANATTLADEEFEKFAAEIEVEAKDDEQRFIFQRLKNGRQAQIRNFSNSHAERELAILADENHKANLEHGLQSWVDADKTGNLTLRESSMRGINRAIDAYIRREGLTENADGSGSGDLYRKGVMASLHTRAIESRIEEDNAEGALAYLEEHQGDLPDSYVNDTRKKLQGDVNQKIVQDNITEKMGRIDSGDLTVGDAVREILKDESLTTPEMKQEAQAELYTRVKAREAARNADAIQEERSATERIRKEWDILNSKEFPSGADFQRFDDSVRRIIRTSGVSPEAATATMKKWNDLKMGIFDAQISAINGSKTRVIELELIEMSVKQPEVFLEVMLKSEIDGKYNPRNLVALEGVLDDTVLDRFRNKVAAIQKKKHDTVEKQVSDIVDTGLANLGRIFGKEGGLLPDDDDPDKRVRAMNFVAQAQLAMQAKFYERYNALPSEVRAKNGPAEARKIWSDLMSNADELEDVFEEDVVVPLVMGKVAVEMGLADEGSLDIEEDSPLRTQMLNQLGIPRNAKYHRTVNSLNFGVVNDVVRIEGDETKRFLHRHHNTLVDFGNQKVDLNLVDGVYRDDQGRKITDVVVDLKGRLVKWVTDSSDVHDPGTKTKIQALEENIESIRGQGEPLPEEFKRPRRRNRRRGR